MTFTSLQAAVDAASEGDRLTVQGLCPGDTFIGKSLAIVGVSSPTSGPSTLSGANESRVMKVPKGVRLRLRDLEVAHGKTTVGGGGIVNKGVLTLRDVLVHDNRVVGSRRISEPRGGGILNDGRLRLKGSSAISANRVGGANPLGGGIFNQGTVTMHDSSSISGNLSEYGDGGGVYNHGTVRMHDSSSISGNTAERFGGGGVYNWSTLTMHGSSSISGNQAVWRGTLEGPGGVYNWGKMIMADSASIRDNSGWYGGVDNEGRLFMRDASSVHNNIGPDVGGIMNEDDGILSMSPSSSVHDNHDGGPRGTEGYRGTGGVFNFDGTLVGVICAPAVQANVRDNSPDDCDHQGP